MSKRIDRWFFTLMGIYFGVVGGLCLGIGVGIVCTVAAPKNLLGLIYVALGGSAIGAGWITIMRAR